MTRSPLRLGLTAAVTILTLFASSGVALGHAERDAFFPDGSGEVPAYRPMIAKPNLVVCTPQSAKRIQKITNPQLKADNLKLLDSCRFRNLQDAVNAVRKRGTTIYMLPGVYRETPYRAQPECAKSLEQPGEEEGAPVLSYEQQLTCPQAQNLVGIFGDIDPADDKRECNAPVCDLQIEGTGQKPGEVLITGGFNKDGNWMKLNGIRGDRADGLYLRNFTIELFEFNAVYVLETDGFVIDKVVSRYNDEYGFLTFAVDHGVYKNCNGYNNGDSLIYPGSASDVNSDKAEYGQTERWAIEIFNCKSHHNALGYSGTAGNSVYAHDNEFYANQAGVVTDSIFAGHPGLPQDHAWFRDNLIYSNNNNYTEKYVHSGICDKPPAERGYKPAKGKPVWAGTVCPVVPAPVGAGMVIAGGNWNLLQDNTVWDNWRAGFMLFSVPGPVREETDPEKAWDTSHFNKYTGNTMSLNLAGLVDLNGVDFWWDDQGEGNCWEKNAGPEDAVTSNTMYPTGLPACADGGSLPVPNNPYKTSQLAPCAVYDRNDPELRDPPGCTFFDTPEEPEE
ncbi:MAG TPA: right-handed parallel beta-helix repeat-containing protein [Actinomycetota bacterium]|nr:right-handed parallel beta-helix repeat-containing protein [Actinomycetota bacterium]